MADANGPLFDWVPPAPSSPKPPDQAAELERVSARIGRAIVDFCQARVGQQFHADELRAHVERSCGQVAPGSADRILRALRQRQVVAYRVIDRSKSLYVVEGA
jgi:hypothetical protein